MGDYCYFEITCRPEDAKRFEAIGFSQFGENMHVEEFAPRYFDSLPRDIPWHGRSESGNDYGALLHACDGKNYTAVQSGNHGGYVVEVKHGNLVKHDRLRILNYERALRRAEKLIAKGKP